MNWIHIVCLHVVFIIGTVQGKPYSIHVSIHYPKGGRKPEVLVSEGAKGKIIKDVKVIQTGDVPDDPAESSPPLLHNRSRVPRKDDDDDISDQIKLIYPEDSRQENEYGPPRPKMVVPTETEQYHMKRSAQKYRDHQHELKNHKQAPGGIKTVRTKADPDLDLDPSSQDLDDSRQDDHNRRAFWKGPMKKHFRRGYKDLPSSHRRHRKPAPRPVVLEREAPREGERQGSSQTYDLANIKAYERLTRGRGRSAHRRREDVEYKEGAVEEKGRAPYEQDYEPDYEDVRAPNGRGPAVKGRDPRGKGRDPPREEEPHPREDQSEKAEDEEEDYPERADDYESFHPFKYQKEDRYDPYVNEKKNIKDGYGQISIVKGCIHVGFMMPNPDDRCGYLECVHAEELHYQQDLVAQRRKCAPGTAVPYSWRGGLDNPCVEAAAYCKNIHEVEDIDEEEPAAPSRPHPPHSTGPKLSDESTSEVSAAGETGEKQE